MTNATFDFAGSLTSDLSNGRVRVSGCGVFDTGSGPSLVRAVLGVRGSE